MKRCCSSKMTRIDLDHHFEFSDSARLTCQMVSEYRPLTRQKSWRTSLRKRLGRELALPVGGCRLQAFAKFDLPAGSLPSEPPQEELEANPELKEGVEPEEAKMETIETNEVREVQLAESPSELQQNPFKSGWVWEQSLKCGPFHFIEDEVFSAGLKLPAWKHARTRQNYRSRKMIEVQSTVQIPVIWGSEGFYADSTNPFSLYNSTSEPRMRRRGNWLLTVYKTAVEEKWRGLWLMATCMN